MGKDTIKGRVNAKWTTSKEFLSNWDRIFGNNFHPCGDLDGDKSGEDAAADSMPCPPNPEQDQILNNNAADGCTEEN